MIRILIVEDEPIKAGKITALIEKDTKKDQCRTSLVANIKDAKELLYEETFDLIILDLVLPFDEEGIPSAENGIQFLEDIYENPSINEPSHIIGLTQVSGLKPQYEEKFHKHKNHLIDYEAESNSWKEQLKNFIWRLIEKEQQFIKNRILPKLDYDYDVAIITALDMELDEVLKLPANWKSIEPLHNDKTNYLEGIFQRGAKKLRVIAASAPQMGMTASSVLSMKLIENFRPKYLIMTGIMACVRSKEEYGFGDIIVADECWDGGAGKITENKEGALVFEQSAKHIPLDSDLREMIRTLKKDTSLFNTIREGSSLKPKTILELHIGPVASVAGVTENQAVVKQLKSHERKLLGLEMETYGVFYAAQNCSNPKPLAISIKSISDFANTEKNDVYHTYAAYTSANFMYHLCLTSL